MHARGRAHQHNPDRNAAQSAVEYLTTYGWAVLIIAVVVVVLLNVGVFNTKSAQARAQPGGCQVYRPGGPGSALSISLEGTCNGEDPKFVAQWGGTSGYVSVPYSSALNPTASFAMSAWVYPASSGSASTILSEQGPTDYAYRIDESPAGTTFRGYITDSS